MNDTKIFHCCVGFEIEAEDLEEAKEFANDVVLGIEKNVGVINAGKLEKMYPVNSLGEEIREKTVLCPKCDSVKTKFMLSFDPSNPNWYCRRCNFKWKYENIPD